MKTLIYPTGKFWLPSASIYILVAQTQRYSCGNSTFTNSEVSILLCNFHLHLYVHHYACHSTVLDIFCFL